MGKDWRVKKGDDFFKITPLPFSPVVQSSPLVRMLMRAIQTKSTSEPRSEAETDLVGDIFSMLYNKKIEYRPDDMISPDREVNKMMLQWLQSQRQFEESRAPTIGSVAASVAASGLTWQVLVSDEAIKAALDEQRRAEEEMQRAREEMEKAIQEAQNGNGDASQEAQLRAAHHEANAKALAKKAVQTMQKLIGNPLSQGLAGSALKKAKETGDAVQSAITGWGMERGAEDTVNVNDILELIGDEKIADIGKLLGKYQVMAHEAIDEARRTWTGSVTEAQNTDDITRIFPEQLMMLGPFSPELLRLETLTRYIDGGLQGIVNIEEKKWGGSFVGMIDGSGSMYGETEVMAKAVALAIAKALHEDTESSRKYILNTFGTRQDTLLTVTSANDWKAHLDWASKMPGGGTDFDFALRKAMDQITKMVGEEGGHTDFLFVTDGEAYIDKKLEKEWREFKAKYHARLIYVNIGGYDNEQVNKIADMKIDIPDYTYFKANVDKVVAQVAENIIKAEMESND